MARNGPLIIPYERGDSAVVRRKIPRLTLLEHAPALGTLYTDRFVDFGLHEPMDVGVDFTLDTDYPQEFSEKQIATGKSRIIGRFLDKFGEGKDIHGIGSLEYADIVSKAYDRVVGAYSHCDTGFHDFGHTLEITEVTQHIIRGYDKMAARTLEEILATPIKDRNVPYIPERISAKYEAALTVAALLHDIGYIPGLFPQDDMEMHSGGALTRVHVARGIEYARMWLRETGFDRYISPGIVTGAINMTDLGVKIYWPDGRPPGHMAIVAQADLLAQMAAPNYIMKLPYLYQEFAACGIDKELGFQKADDIIKNTPRFLESVARPRLAYVSDLLYRAGDNNPDPFSLNMWLNGQHARAYTRLVDKAA